MNLDQKSFVIMIEIMYFQNLYFKQDHDFKNKLININHIKSIYHLWRWRTAAPNISASLSDIESLFKGTGGGPIFINENEVFPSSVSCCDKICCFRSLIVWVWFSFTIMRAPVEVLTCNNHQDSVLIIYYNSF